MARKEILALSIFISICGGVWGCNSGSGGDGDPNMPPWEGDTATDTNPEGVPVFEIDDPSILINPYGNTHFVAVIAVSHDELQNGVYEIHVNLVGQGDEQPGYTEYLYSESEAFQTNFDMSDILETGQLGIPVFGLYPGVSNTVNFRIYSEEAVGVGTTTISLPEYTDNPHETAIIHAADTGSMEPGWITMDGWAFDHFGNLRRDGGQIHRKLENGNFLDSTRVNERSVLGRLLINRTDDLPDHLSPHHDSIEMPSQNILVCMDNSETTIINGSGLEAESLEDYVVELDYESSLIVNAWDMREFLDVDRYTVSVQATDWLHMNTVCYDDYDDSILMSARYQGIAKMTRGGIQGDEANAGKSLKWILAPHLAWGMAGFDGQGDVNPNDHLLTAVDSTLTPYSEDVQNNLAAPGQDEEPFHWPIGQHGLEITGRSEGKLRFLTFNNQGSVIFDGPDSINNQLYGDLGNDRTLEPYSMIIEYEVDEVEMTVRQVWSYGEEMPEYYCSYRSTVDLFPSTGNRLLASCGVDRADIVDNPFNPHMVELDDKGDVVFHLELQGTDHGLYRSTRIQLHHPDQS